MKKKRCPECSRNLAKKKSYKNGAVDWHCAPCGLLVAVSPPTANIANNRARAVLGLPPRDDL